MGKYIVWGLYTVAVVTCLFWLVHNLANGQPDLGLLQPSGLPFVSPGAFLPV
ncbi:MAG: hypothetical protein KKE73_00830 [Proteobacteria bacterium]|nr:hypothetical protein [Pseudomonadota bacterium]